MDLDQTVHIIYKIACRSDSSHLNKFPWSTILIQSLSIKWEYRMAGGSIGKIIYIHPAVGNLYYLCLLLNEIKGTRRFVDLWIANGVVYTIYKKTCFSLGILGDDSYWSNALIQATLWVTGIQLRQFFITMILFWKVGDKKILSYKHW